MKTLKTIVASAMLCLLSAAVATPSWASYPVYICQLQAWTAWLFGPGLRVFDAVRTVSGIHYILFRSGQR